MNNGFCRHPYGIVFFHANIIHHRQEIRNQRRQKNGIAWPEQFGPDFVVGYSRESSNTAQALYANDHSCYYKDMKTNKKKLNVYLDNCSFNRPFDDQIQVRVAIETKAKLYIQKMILAGNLRLSTSFMSISENNDNPFEDRRIPIKEFLRNRQTHIEYSEEIVNKAVEISSLRTEPKDSLHIACAIAAGCDFFITTDDRLLKLNIDEITIINPVDFIKIKEINK
jgi:predicted nucleic acid-binding protein